MRVGGLSLAAFLLATATGAAPAPAERKPAAGAEKPKKKAAIVELDGEPVEFKTKDGWTLSGRYLEAKKDNLTFVLLHEDRGRLQNWSRLARAMARRGIGYLALDLRGHGLSLSAPPGSPSNYRDFRSTKRDNDWDDMREDVAGAVDFLVGRGLAMDAIGIGGARVGGSVGLKYAALHPEIAMIFLLSPGFSYREVLTVNAMRAFKERPILLVVANDDRKSSTETAILHEFAKRSAGVENASLLRTGRGWGTRMFYYNKGLVQQVLDWIDDPFRPPEAGVEGSTGSARGEPPPGDEGGLPSDDELESVPEQPMPE